MPKPLQTEKGIDRHLHKVLDGDGNLTALDISTDSVRVNKFSIAGGTEMAGILDEDDMASDDANALATQQSIKAYTDSKLFSVHVDQVNYRMSSVNNSYIFNLSQGTSVAAADWTYAEGGYSLYTTGTEPTVIRNWRWIGGMNASADYEFMLYDMTIPPNNISTAGTVAQIGSTQSETITNRWYSVGETGLNYTLAAGHSVYLLIRYTSGSGTKYTYGTFTMDMDLL